MNNEKRLLIKRLAIFLVISFLPFMILIPILWASYGGPIFAETDEHMNTITYIVGVFGMMIPSVAVLITRRVTGEGFADSYLGLHVKGKVPYWAASIIVPLIEGLATMFLITAVFINDIPFGDAFGGLDTQKAGTLLMYLSFSVIVFFPAFGEEWGWRGYMMPKLLRLMPKPAAIVVGGVIWGLWHAPLTVAGHNFGTDYPGYPFTGIGLMCIFCVLMNCILTLVTEKTRSIYPAAFIHMIHNNVSSTTLFLILAKRDVLLRETSLRGLTPTFLMLGVTAVTAAVSLVLLIRPVRKPETDG